MTEAMQNLVDGTIIELRPRMMRKRLQAIKYGRGTHASMRTPLEEALHVAGVVAGVAIIGLGVLMTVLVSV